MRSVQKRHYRVCAICGASLDPCEICDCEERTHGSKEETETGRHKQHMEHMESYGRKERGENGKRAV